MSVSEHKSSGPRRVRVFVLTISDTRTEASDSSGQLARELLTAAGHDVTGYAIVKDEPAQVAGRIRAVIAEKAADVVITNGGTGISPRDTTYEAVSALLDKRLDGFGELFRMLSFQDIGSAAMLSRAVAGLSGGVFVFATPGSTPAVRLALEKLIIPELSHLVGEKKKHGARS